MDKQDIHSRAMKAKETQATECITTNKEQDRDKHRTNPEQSRQQSGQHQTGNLETHKDDIRAVGC